ncbi:MAG: FadR family transcriptional regulator [Thalassovita sp.]
MIDGTGIVSLNKTLSRSLSAQVSRQIGERILDGQLDPGQMLPDENALCAEFGVSRTVVREAVKMLVAKGMLEVRQRIGTRVQEVRNWQMLDRDVLLWHQALVVEDERLLRLMELRQSIEPDAAYFAAQRHTEEDLNEIFGALDRMSKHVGQNSEYVLADALFHVSVLRAAHNPYLDALENAIFAGLMLSIRVTNPDQKQNELSVPLHRNVAEAIRAGDAEAAREGMKAHLADSSHRLEKVL